MSDTYERGDVVNITIRGARITEVGDIALGVALSGGRFSRVPLDCEDVTIERIAPAEWPPRTGDLWRDREGDVWFAVEDEDGTITMVCQVTACVSRPPDEFMRTLDPLTFVYREDEQDGGTR